MEDKSRGSDEAYNRLINRVFDDEEGLSKGDPQDETLWTRVREWWAARLAQHRERTVAYGPVEWLAMFLPIVRWIRHYKREYLVGDIAAGLSIGVMVVPQGMSYAALAGLPTVYGLYGAFVPVLVYALFGSSPQLSVGPVAVTSLLLSTGLHSIVAGSDGISDPSNPKDTLVPGLDPPTTYVEVQSKYNQAAVQIAFLVALLYFAVGLLQLAFLANFLSHAVISGFTSGASIIIACSQLKYFFGVKTKNTNSLIETIDALKGVVPDHYQWREMLMFASWVVLLLTIKKVSKTYKKLSWIKALGPITVCIIAIVLVKAASLQDKIRTVAKIPSGLPSPTISAWGPLFSGKTDFGKQITLALVIMLVGFMESISIAKALARRGKYPISVPREIVSLGLANFFGSMFAAYPTTGSFSRSAVSADIGSNTGLFGIISSALVMLVLLLLTPVFELVPYNAMGAIVVSACIGLFEGSEAVFLYRANFPDFLVWVAAFVGTVLAGVEIGLAIAIGLAILIVVYNSAFPHTATLGRLPGTTVYRSTKQYPSAMQPQGMLIMRVDAPIYFANVEVIRMRLEKYLEKARMDPAIAPIKFLIMDLSPVPFVDATGMHAFLDIASGLKDDGIQMVLANPCSSVKAHLSRVHLLEAIGKEWIFIRTADAVDVCSRELLETNGKLMSSDDAPDGGGPVSEAADGVARASTLASPGASPRAGPSAGINAVPIGWTGKQ